MKDDVPIFIIAFIISVWICGALFGDNVTYKDIENANVVCEKNDNVRVIKSYILSNDVICKNGAKFEVAASWLKEERK